MKNTISVKTQENAEICINGKRVILIDTAIRELFEHQKLKLEENNSLTIYRSIMYRGIKFTSEKIKEVSTVDYFVRVGENLIGAVNFYTAIEFNLYVLLNVYDVVEIVDHFKKIYRTETD